MLPTPKNLITLIPYTSNDEVIPLGDHTAFEKRQEQLQQKLRQRAEESIEDKSKFLFKLFNT